MQFIADCHADTLSRLLMLEEDEMSLYLPQPKHHSDYPRMRQAGLRLQIFSIFTMPYEAGHYGAVRSLQMMQVFREDIRKHPAHFALIENKKDLQAVENGPDKLYGLFSMEGASPLCGDLKMLEVFYRQGLRAIGLTWNHRNELADGLGVGSNYGLTPFGRDVIKRMNELGMVVDLAHINEAGFWEALELSKDPIIVSHANAKSLCGHRRNMNDEQLKAIQAQNGFVGLCFAPSFLNNAPEKASLEDAIRHIDYLCEQMGPDHVAFGSDYDGIENVPQGLEDVSCFPNLLTRLRQLGYKEEDISKMAFGNVLRVYRTVLKD
ncbi:dipeptidase [bacterium (Candidatus Blackallbacteria) CG17_big_fil_post_rev_8_21_14_2_50_48_46]|uniref:Dipeptidase n=1 Tax=bacterium (Candidatus Blackallbacteria) CG17_big_fil_post_rev_8_21_14_2_50_48_46 TaxID=2014261 RepID=A0A2M7G6X8_9BACT|nr:MAG: dipeptidase [bacterium (Candidatus Blackallbacteria) CG18_big_fil_WC_8_21_14_2_50_49_26]PIW17816.1 MAG: dipeptidase [bacterium (Candidatus Blackallbacteria) CG17_big_fil_post_rev_8_21_14_2_50_48_46]PIW48492.1 MAG: dipeptidase [bacterium (Candidatus Blackallbacteria) CG13_big_fil_rev_8_21_14_2_50_49_14]